MSGAAESSSAEQTLSRSVPQAVPQTSNCQVTVNLVVLPAAEDAPPPSNWRRAWLDVHWALTQFMRLFGDNPATCCQHGCSVLLSTAVVIALVLLMEIRINEQAEMQRNPQCDLKGQFLAVAAYTKDGLVGDMFEDSSHNILCWLQLQVGGKEKYASSPGSYGPDWLLWAVSTVARSGPNATTVRGALLDEMKSFIGAATTIGGFALNSFVTAKTRDGMSDLQKEIFAAFMWVDGLTAVSALLTVFSSLYFSTQCVRIPNDLALILASGHVCTLLMLCLTFLYITIFMAFAAVCLACGMHLDVWEGVCWICPVIVSFSALLQFFLSAMGRSWFGDSSLKASGIAGASSNVPGVFLWLQMLSVPVVVAISMSVIQARTADTKIYHYITGILLLLFMCILGPGRFIIHGNGGFSLSDAAIFQLRDGFF